MTEYIMQVDYDTLNGTFTHKKREEIVRCRDCVHYRKHKWFKVVVGTPLGTDISDVCMFFADGCKVEPDGFCAWGERKEGGDD